MPSMTTSHGGILYYVVKVPKEEPEVWTSTPGQRSFDDKVTGAVATSTPLLGAAPTSTDSGWDNPFRPDGDLSREADEIVELIKGGKPITPTPLNGEAPKLPESNGTENGKVPSPTKASTVTASPPKPAKSNGTKPLSNGDKSAPKSTPGQVELQRTTITPSDPVQAEHVNLKKKPKCKCCVVQ
uniref:Uncharacterized protein n=1 Tax=Lygus hesperus TaxID=30085 RepID=A0A0A9XM08_LYGHE